MDTTFVEVTNISELGGSSVFGVSIDALVSTSIAILVFGLGLFFTRKREIVNKYAHLIEIEAYVFEIFSEIREGVKERIKSFNSLIEQLKEERQTNIKMEYISDYSVEFIEEIDWIDYYSVFSKLRGNEREKSVSIFKNVNKSIAVIKDVSKLWRESFDELVKRQLEYERRWHEHITTVASLTDDFVSWAHNSYIKGSNSFIDALDKTLYDHQHTPESVDLYIARNSLIDPLHNLIKNNPTEYWGRRYLDSIMGCIYAYDNYTNNKIVFSQQFEIYIKKLSKVDESIDKSVQDLKGMESTKPKFWSLYW